MTTKILIGHVLDVLAGMPDDSVHCVVTSPPYWGLRDYGIEPQVWGGDAGCEHEWDEEVVRGEMRTGANLKNSVHSTRGGGHKLADVPNIEATRAFCRHCTAWRGSLGLEPTIELYVEHMVAVFAEVRRVLRKDGTCWMNLGDCYTSNPASGGPQSDLLKGPQNATPTPSKWRRPPGLKPKDLCMIPARVAIALQANGWWLRSEIVWAKPNPMPESCTDRPTSAHEKMYLLTKSARYFYDAEAVREPAEYGRRDGSTFGRVRSSDHQDPREDDGDPVRGRHPETGRNLRNVWTIATAPYPDAHFATFPPKLVEPCIKAGTSEKGVCADCAAPWVRETETPEWYKELDGHKLPSGTLAEGVNAGFGAKRDSVTKPSRTTGWSPSCACDADVIPATVLDIFGGAGTTGLVADRLGRDAILIEINPDYAGLASGRIHDDAPLFAVTTDG